MGVTLDVPAELRTPELEVGLRHPAVAASRVLMKKAAMDKDDRAKSGKRQVGRTGQIPSMQAEAIPHRMHKAPDLQLKLSVLTLHSAHDATSGASIDGVQTTLYGEDCLRLLKIASTHASAAFSKAAVGLPSARTSINLGTAPT